LAGGSQGTGDGAPTNHKLSNQESVDRHPLFYISKKWRLGFTLELGHKKKEVEMSQETWAQEKRNQNEKRQKKSKMREEGKEVLTLS
jgi:hypothetical protein